MAICWSRYMFNLVSVSTLCFPFERLESTRHVPLIQHPLQPYFSADLYSFSVLRLSWSKARILESAIDRRHLLVQT